jgi:hypothetical protein
MYDTVGIYLTERPAQLNLIAEFPNSLADFIAKVKEIKSLEVARQSATSGKTDSKYLAEDALIKSTANVASSLAAYARKKNLPELKSIVDVSARKLDRMKEVDLIAKCTQIYNEAKKIAITELTGYGLTAEEIEDVKTKADVFTEASGKRNSSVAERSGTGLNIIDLFNEADDILEEELDKFANKFIDSDKAYYDGYYAARNIKDLGKRHNDKDDEQPNDTNTPNTPTPPET